MCELTTLEQCVLNHIQQDFPLAPDPYQVLAEALVCRADDAHAAVQALCARGIIRRIGASFAAAKLGYVSTLVAARVAAEALERAALAVDSFPEVTHNYQRDGAYNLWFTIIAPRQQRIDEILDAVRACTGVYAVAPLPARRIFKLRVDFRFPAGNAPTHAYTREAHSTHPEAAALVLSELDRRLIARVSGDLGASRHPYHALAAEFELTEDAVLRRLRDFQSAGMLRRLGAVLRHQLAGFTANGLSAWDVPDAEVAEVGEQMAAIPSISHCYERPRLPDWPYNLYAMLHAPTRASCAATAADIAARVGINAYLILYSVREFKKTSLQYFSPDG